MRRTFKDPNGQVATVSLLPGDMLLPALDAGEITLANGTGKPMRVLLDPKDGVWETLAPGAEATFRATGAGAWTWADG